MPLRIEHSVIDLSALPRRRTDEAANSILYGADIYGAECSDDCPRPLIDLREISRPGCHYVIASRMFRTPDVKRWIEYAQATTPASI